MSSRIRKLASCTCAYFVTNIVLNVRLVIVPLNKLEGPFFAKMACKGVLMKTCKEFTPRSLVVWNIQAVKVVQQSVVPKVPLPLNFLIPFASSMRVVCVTLSRHK